MLNKIKSLKNKIKHFMFFISIAITESSYAQSVSVSSMFSNFQLSAQSLIKLIIAASMVIGLYLIANSIYKLAVLGDSGGQRGETLKGPLVKFFIGVALFSLMFSLRTVGETMMMGTGPGNFLLSSSSMSSSSQAAIIGILWFIRMIGFLAVVRGFLLLDKHGRGGQDSELGRGLTHIFGGAAAIHIDKTARILANTFAPGLSLPI